MTRVATINLPFGRDGHKRRLLAPAKRASAAIHFLNRHRVGLVTLQELASPSAAVIRLRHRRWAIVTARPNNVFRRLSLFNAIAYRRDEWRMTGREDIRVPMPGRRRGLNMLALTLVHRRTGERVTVIGVHNPRRKTDAATNQRARAIQTDRALRLAAEGRRVLVMGDFNDGHADDALRDAGMRVGAAHGVDVIAGLGVTFGRSEHHAVPFSDHAAVIADVRLT